MVREPVGPWAEPVLLTADDLKALPENVWRYELVHGRLVRMPPTGFQHGTIGSRLVSALENFVDAHALGRVTAAETGFLLSQPDEPDTVLAPDVAFISADRVPTPDTPDWTGFPRLAPDLVVEIASPGQHRPEMAIKANTWLAAGVRLVWVVWPSTQQVEIWEPDREPAMRTLMKSDELDGGTVLPGFTFPISRLWT